MNILIILQSRNIFKQYSDFDLSCPKGVLKNQHFGKICKSQRHFPDIVH